jgi:magnesium chelatase subunit H
VAVDAIVSTIGFPLVGGPAGSMEAGRREEVAQRILRAKNVPYLVSAPLLIQDLHSWTRQGIGGLQSVVLFALPELDGAIDPGAPGRAGGGSDPADPRATAAAHRAPEGLDRPAPQTPSERRLAIVLYGFPPGYGATGTAALLNVPHSLMAVLKALKAEGYDVGFPAGQWRRTDRHGQARPTRPGWARIPEGQRFEEDPEQPP